MVDNQEADCKRHAKPDRRSSQTTAAISFWRIWLRGGCCPRLATVR